MRINVSGAKDLYRFAHALNEAGNTGLKRELDKASRRAGDALADEVRAHTDDYIPQTFEDDWKRSMQSRVEVRLVQSRRITVVFWANGAKGHRKIREINAGNLRHPVFGRTRPLKRHWIHKATSQINPWVDQAIRPGLVDEPVKRATPKAVQELDDAVHRVVARIEREG